MLPERKNVEYRTADSGHQGSKLSRGGGVSRRYSSGIPLPGSISAKRSKSVSYSAGYSSEHLAASKYRIRETEQGAHVFFRKSNMSSSKPHSTNICDNEGDITIATNKANKARLGPSNSLKQSISSLSHS
jgi:hypothetical protein